MLKKILGIVSIFLLIIIIITPMAAGYNNKSFIESDMSTVNYYDLKYDKNTGTEYWGLLVAVGTYLNHPDENRPNMLIEIENLYDTLIGSENWDSNHIKKIKAEDATLENILEGLSWLCKMEDKRDFSLVYITTHGFHLSEDIWPFDEDDGHDEALVPYEGFDDTSKFLWDDLLNFYLSFFDSRGICVIIDSCFSGGFNDDSYNKISNNKILDTSKMYSNINNYESWILDFSEEIAGNGRVVLMSSEEDEVSYGSYFSRYINRGLDGLADKNNDQICSAEEVFYYAKQHVESIGWQHPTMVDWYPGELLLTGSINIKKDIIYELILEVHPRLFLILRQFLNI